MEGFIIRTRKMSAKEVKKKFHEMVDEFTEENENPEVDQMAEELKKHGDQFIDSLCGKGTGASYRGNTSFRDGGMGGGMSYRGNGGGTSFRNGGMHYRNEGEWQGGGQQGQQKLQQLEQELQQLRQEMAGGRYE